MDRLRHALGSARCKGNRQDGTCQIKQSSVSSCGCACCLEMSVSRPYHATCCSLLNVATPIHTDCTLYRMLLPASLASSTLHFLHNGCSVAGRPRRPQRHSRLGPRGIHATYTAQGTSHPSHSPQPQVHPQFSCTRPIARQVPTHCSEPISTPSLACTSRTSAPSSHAHPACSFRV